MRPALFAALGLALAACSPGDQHKAANDIKETAANLPGTIREGTNSAAGAEFQAGVKGLAKDTGQALKEGAKETKQALDKQVGEEKR